MHIYCYVDFWFLLQLSMNYLLIDISLCFLSYSVSVLQKILAGSAGSAGVLLLFAIQRANYSVKNEIGIQITFKIGYLFILTLIMSRILKKLQDGMVLLSAVLFGVTLTSGGFYYWCRNYFLMNSIDMLIIMFFCDVVVHIFRNFIKQKKVKREHIVYVKMQLKEHSITTKGLLDSGNCLVEPYTNRPVVIVSTSLMKQIDDQTEHSLMIPFYSLGNENGLLSIQKINEICIWHEGEKEKHHFRNVYVAEDEKVFLHQKDYQVILNQVMFC